MIILHDPEGNKIYTDSKDISYMKDNNGIWDHRAKTILIISGQHQAVRENINEIQEIIHGQR